MGRFSPKDWGHAKVECTEALKQRAEVRGQITYGDLVQKITSIRFEPNDHDFHRLLGELSEESFEEGEFMISSIVVHKYGDMQPGQGFTKLAENLGLDASDPLKLWVEQMKHTHSYFTKP